MKNFTNNFKQFTSRLSARWLIMALMLLVGTSSAWAVDYYLRGTFNSWGTNNKFLNNTCTITLEANKEYTFKIASSDWNNDNTYGKTNSNITETCEIELLNNTNNQAAGDCKITTKDAGSYTFVFTPNGSKGTLKVTYPTPTPTAPVVSTTSAVIDGENLVCKGKVTSMGSASTVVWAFTVLSTDAISKADSDWKYPNGQNQITAANTSFTYNIPISSLSLTKGNTYYVRAMAVDLGNLGFSNNQYGNAVAGDAISFLYDPCSTPAAPTFDAIAAKCGSYTLPAEDKNQVSVNWYTAATDGSKITSVITTDTYYAEAVDGTCTSAERTPVQITINPLPNISISGNNSSAVLYEDVTLTATGSDIDEVNWTITSGPGTLSNTTGTSVKLTSSTAGTVTVTATATSAASCTSAATKTVTFSEENCNSTTTTEQQTVGKTKIIVDNPQNWSTMKCYAWRTSDNKEILGGWSGTEMTKNGNNYEILIDFAEKGISESDKIKVIFNNGSSQTVDSDDVSCNKIYRFSIGSKSGDKYSFTSQAADIDPYTEPVEVTVDPEISAPAAKTISVSTTDGEGNIIFSGQVVKTGCDATNEYGFQYSSDQQTWTTVKVGENAVAGTAISNNTVKGLDGTYYVRAYITNDNSTQYGAIKDITVSTKKYPITKVTLTHVKNQAGDSYSDQELANLIYCVGDTVWFKLEQDGSDFQEYDWISYPGTGLKGMYPGGMFKLKITESGNVGIRLRNDANVDGEGNPTWVESNLLEFKTHPEPTAPTISFATATICSTNNVGATLTLGATVSGQAYELWKYANDDDTEGSKVANVATLNCTENNQALQFSGIKTAGKYFVKTYYTAFCNTVTANSSYATLTVVNAEDVSISITPATATTTPWMPVKLTISATDDYTLEVPEGVEFSQNGNICSVKIPLPDGATGGEGQYENVSFPQDSYTVTANLVSTGGEDNPCAVPATATITLTPYVEECTIGH